MRKSGKILLALPILMFFLAIAQTEAQQLWTNISMNKQSVYVGEPMQVSISVYTETWFTRGIDVGNINVSGAFSSYFRPVSVSATRDGKTYPGVQLIYNIFPYVEKDIIFPSLEIKVETPKVGGYKGISRKVKTQARKINVKPVPDGMESKDWLVASNLIVTEHWSGSLKDVKVGDVMERSITRQASGTLAELIPQSVWDTINGVNTYPGKSSIDNFETKTSISSKRKESVRYLFEQEGIIQIPERVYTWYNPVSKKLYKRTLKAHTVNVNPNPNLGMLQSIRDSLQVQNTKTSGTETETLRILGLSPRDLAIACISGLLVCYLLVKLLKSLWAQVTAKREAYKNSEAYYFRKLKSAIKSKQEAHTINALYRWIDELHLDVPTFESLKASSIKENMDISELTISKAKSMRKEYAKRKDKSPDNNWITPP
ncbi:MAG: hypothetical protein ACK5L5_11615 [Bacteroidales bacterium]